MTFTPDPTDEVTENSLRDHPLNERIYRIRKKLGLSQEALAKEAGVSVKTVVRWERHRNSEAPNRTSRERLSRLTGYSEDLFLLHPPDPVRSQDAIVTAIDRNLEALQQLEARLEDRIDAQLSRQESLLATLSEVASTLSEATSTLLTVAERLDAATKAPPQRQQPRRSA